MLLEFFMMLNTFLCKRFIKWFLEAYFIISELRMLALRKFLQKLVVFVVVHLVIYYNLIDCYLNIDYYI